MFASFFRYFISYIFKARTRQRLLFLALFSLALSSFALVVLQGVMTGLQSSLVKRSKEVYGDFYVDVSTLDRKTQDKIILDLDDYEIPAYPERETELMVRHQSHIAPMILHGVNFDKVLPFIDGYNHEGIILGADISRKLQAFYGGELQLVTPSEMENLLGDVPRTMTVDLVDIVQTDVTEVDLLHGWVRENVVFNLLRELEYNKIRFMGLKYLDQVEEIVASHCSDCRIITWDETHNALKWALNLESKVMLFLFIAMAFLVAISITAGLLIFYDKVKKDMASFWILGLDKKSIYQMSSIFSYSLNILACVIGVILGVVSLQIMEKYSGDIMPDVFVERNLPIEITIGSILISLFIPMIIAFIFTSFSVRMSLNEQKSFLSLIRGQNT